MDVNEKIQFCEHHIKELNDRLAKIYTISEKEATKDGKKEQNINIAKEIEKLKFLESAYSVIEKEGVAEGKTYEQYSHYLCNVRNSLRQYKKTKKEIEQNNAEEIKNINILLNAFEKRLESLNTNY